MKDYKEENENEKRNFESGKLEKQCNEENTASS